MGFDILLEADFTITEVQSALAIAFDLPIDRFFMVDGFIGDYFDDNGVFTLDYKENDSRNLCEVYKLKGEFKTKIDLGTGDSVSKHTLESLAKSLAKILKSKTLFGSENLNPYNWIDRKSTRLNSSH